MLTQLVRRASVPRVRLDQPAVKPEINPALERFVHLLDESIPIPGTSARIGLDGLIGLIPGVGDLVTLVFGYFMLKEAKRLGLPRHKQSIMVANYLLDLVGGFVPVVGDIWDFAFKANRKNLRLMRKHLEKVKG
jgi:hypothetical protein